MKFNIKPTDLCELIDDIDAVYKTALLITYNTFETKCISSINETKQFIQNKGSALNIFIENIGQLTLHKQTIKKNIYYLGFVSTATDVENELTKACMKYNYEPN